MKDKSPHLEAFTTERRNPASIGIDMKSTEEILEMINREDQTIPSAVKKEIPSIRLVVDRVVEVFKNGGRLFYVGAGTSGRMGMLDASECPSTFGTDPDMVQAIIAGGNEALVRTVEWIEDDEEYGSRIVIEKGVTSKDILIGISASGYAPFVIGAMKKAREEGASVVFLNCNPPENSTEYSDYTISVDVGPEIITGSTRMKSGTAQKMILNMITTTAMIKLGKVYSNLMVDMRPVNSKLVQRSIHIIEMATGCSRQHAEDIFDESEGNIKAAILMIILNTDLKYAEELLEKHNGSISRAVNSMGEKREDEYRSSH